MAVYVVECCETVYYEIADVVPVQLTGALSSLCEEHLYVFHQHTGSEWFD